MSDSIETKGKTVDLAVSEALLQLGLRRDEVEIKVLEEPRAGLMGFLGARQAKVLVSKRPPGRGGRGGGRDRRRDEDHRAHDLSASGATGRGRGRGGRGSSGGGGRDDNRGGGRDRNEARGERGERGGANDRGGPNDRGGQADRGGPNDRGGRGRRDEPRAEARDQQAPRQRPAAEGRADGPREDLAEGQRSRRRRGGRGRGGRGRSGQGDAARADQPNGNVNGNAAMPTERAPRREDGERSERGGRGDNGGRGGRGGRGERPPRDREEVRVDEFEAPRVTAPAVEQPRGPEVPRERAREERSRRDQHPAAAAAAAAAAEDQPNAATPEGEAVKPDIIETAVIANAAPRTKPKAWGGLGARRDRTPVVQPLAKVDEPSPATVGSVFKPSRKAVARAAAAAAAAERPAPSAPRVGAVEAPYAGGYTSSGARNTGDEAIATGIAATDYAKPMAPVDADGQPGLLTEVTTGMLARAGFPCECETLPGEYHAVKVSADEDSAGMLIGRGGSTAEAIEHLVERMASNAAGDRVRMNLDINDYRIGREDSLRQHTLDAVAEVRASGKPYHMEPMDARERRVVHLEVESMPDLTTITVIGSGGKHVVISLNDGSQTDEGDDD